jgi:hypothetical protein
MMVNSNKPLSVSGQTTEDRMGQTIEDRMLRPVKIPDPAFMPPLNVKSHLVLRKEK